MKKQNKTQFETATATKIMDAILGFSILVLGIFFVQQQFDNAASKFMIEQPNGFRSVDVIPMFAYLLMPFVFFILSLFMFYEAGKKKIYSIGGDSITIETNFNTVIIPWNELKLTQGKLTGSYYLNDTKNNKKYLYLGHMPEYVDLTNIIKEKTNFENTN